MVAASFPDEGSGRPPQLIWEVPRFEKVELAAKSSDYCIVVTTWEEGDRLRRQLQRMEPYAGLVDIIVADRRSADGSTEPGFLRGCGVRTLLRTDETGLGTAIRMGLAYGIDEGYRGFLTIDGNGKDGVEAIPQFVTCLEDGYDLVQGSRFLPDGAHRNTPLDRFLGIRLIVSPLLSAGARGRVSDPTNGFRAMSRRFLLDVRLQPIRKVFVGFNLQLYLVRRALQLGGGFKEIPVSRHYPATGPTPTKIIGLRRKLEFVRELLATVRGAYDCD